MKNVVHLNKGVVRASVKEEKRKAKSKKQKAKSKKPREEFHLESEHKKWKRRIQGTQRRTQRSSQKRIKRKSSLPERENIKSPL